MPRASSASLVLLLALSPALAGCSGSDEASRPDASNASETVDTASPATPEGVVVTEPGTELGFGDGATVTWRPTASLTGVLELVVEKVVEPRPAVLRGWLRDDGATDSRPYFATVTVANVGEDDLGGHQVPLYVLDGEGRLAAPWTMAGDFAPCQSGPLSDPFPAGEEAELCLVFLVPEQGTADAVVFQPSESFDPIRWTGRVRTPKGAPPQP